MRIILSVASVFCAIGAFAGDSDALLLKTSVQCVIKNIAIENHRSSLGTNAVSLMTSTVELVNYATNTFDIERDSLVIALHTARLSDTNGFAWEINSPLSRYQYHALDAGQRDFLTLRGNSTNQLEVKLTSLDAPFVLVNRQLLMSDRSYHIPDRMFGSIFTTVLGRVDGQQRVGKILLQGASTFAISHETPKGSR